MEFESSKSPCDWDARIGHAKARLNEPIAAATAVACEHFPHFAQRFLGPAHAAPGLRRCSAVREAPSDGRVHRFAQNDRATPRKRQAPSPRYYSHDGCAEHDIQTRIDRKPS